MEKKKVNPIKVYTHEGKKKIQFVNAPNNTTQTFDAQEVWDVLDEFMKEVE